MKSKPLFANFEVNDKSRSGIKAKFDRDQKEVLDKYGFTKGSANLSVLPEIPSDFESLHIDLAQDAVKDKARSKAKAQREKRKLELMNSIEQNNLSSSTNAIHSTPATESNNNDNKYQNFICYI